MQFHRFCSTFTFILKFYTPASASSLFASDMAASRKTSHKEYLRVSSFCTSPPSSYFSSFPSWCVWHYILVPCTYLAHFVCKNVFVLFSFGFYLELWVLTLDSSLQTKHPLLVLSPSFCNSRLPQAAFCQAGTWKVSFLRSFSPKTSCSRRKWSCLDIWTFYLIPWAWARQNLKSSQDSYNLASFRLLLELKY